jgi:hypothetical protein
MHGTEGGSSLIYGGGAPIGFEKLLRAATALDLCLFCHEANSLGMSSPTPPDVKNNTLGYIASAGDFMHGNSANNRNRHNLGEVVGDPPGYTGTWSNVTGKFGTLFNCLYCHDQHGNKNYRNLRYDPGTPSNDTESVDNLVSFSVDASGCSDGTSAPCDVKNTDFLPADNLDKYKRDIGSIQFFKTGAKDYNRISEWCGKCHNDFYGQSGNVELGGSGVDDDGVGAGDPPTPDPWVRHPVGDVNIGQNTNLHSDFSTLGAAGYNVRYADATSPPAVGGDEQPFCLSCHYAHGGGNPNSGTNPGLDHSMLVFTDTSGGDVNIAPPGDAAGQYQVTEGLMRNTCQRCHNQ